MLWLTVPVRVAPGVPSVAKVTAYTGTVPVPVSDTAWVVPAWFRVLSVTVMVPLRAPTDWGVNCTCRSPKVPGAREVPLLIALGSTAFWGKLAG